MDTYWLDFDHTGSPWLFSEQAIIKNKLKKIHTHWEVLLESLQMPLKCKSLEMLRGANEQQSLCFHLKKNQTGNQNQTWISTDPNPAPTLGQSQSS